MTLRKSDLYSSLWKSCDELRGGMDASQYKDYILTLLFVKYVSDKAKTDKNSLIDVPAGGSFDDMVALKGDKEIGDKINKIIAKLAEANDLQKVIDQADFNDEEKLGKGKEMQDRLTKLVSIFADLDFRGSRAEGDDLLGDAYEYLMRHFATESGKSKGQFYTPAEVSRILAKVVGIGPNTKQDQTVYDPTCGSGSLLLKVADEAPHGITIYGQEKDNATWALSKMNMILHGNEIADIRKGDTITSPQLLNGAQLRTFDFAVANPPFSVKSWSNGLENDYGRFEFGRPPEKNGDYAFLLHVLKSLKSTGKAAVILPHGVLLRSAESTIRKSLIERGFIKAIIGLPPNLFYGTPIPACIIILDKENAQSRTGIFMVNASGGFMKDASKNRLRSQDIHKIVDVVNRQIEIPRYSRMVPVSDIANSRNDFNLNIRRYVDSSIREDIQDLPGHLAGGIPDRDVDDLTRYWVAFPKLRSQLFTAKRQGYVELALDTADVRRTVLDSAEFKSFRDTASTHATEWFAAHRPALRTIDTTTRPSELIAKMGDDLLGRFKQLPLIDEYNVYEKLMAYWHETMHDDVSMVMGDGWRRAAEPRATIQDKDRKLAEKPDLVIGTGRNAARYKMDLVPPPLIVDQYFSNEQTRVDELAGLAKEATAALDEFVDEHGVVDGLLAEAMEDDKLSKSLAIARLKVAKREGSDPEEVAALEQVSQLFAAEAATRRAAKEAKGALDRLALQAYNGQSEEQVATLVIDCKWGPTLANRIASEVDSMALALVDRVQRLGRRYAEPADVIQTDLNRLGAQVAQHLVEMAVDQKVVGGKSRLPGFSARWKPRRFLDLVTIRAGQVSPLDERFCDLPLIGPEHVESSTGKLLEVTSAKNQGAISGKYLVRRGDVVYGKINPHLRKAVLSPFDALCSADMYPFTAGPDVDSTYLLYLVLGEEFTNYATSVSARSGIPKINREELGQLTIHVPDIDEQREIAQVLRDATRQIDRTQDYFEKLSNVRLGIIQALTASGGST